MPREISPSDNTRKKSDELNRPNPGQGSGSRLEEFRRDAERRTGRPLGGGRLPDNVDASQYFSGANLKPYDAPSYPDNKTLKGKIQGFEKGSGIGGGSLENLPKSVRSQLSDLSDLNYKPYDTPTAPDDEALARMRDGGRKRIQGIDADHAIQAVYTESSRKANQEIESRSVEAKQQHQERMQGLAKDLRMKLPHPSTWRAYWQANYETGKDKLKIVDERDENFYADIVYQEGTSNYIDNKTKDDKKGRYQEIMKLALMEYGK